MSEFKIIKAKCGAEIKVSAEDFDWLNEFKWHIKRSNPDRMDKRGYRSGGHPYVHAMIGGKNILMHRLVMNAPDGLMVDHINRDTFDNRRENLRLADNSINMINSKDRDRELPRNIFIQKREKGRRNNPIRYRVEFFRDKKRVVRKYFHSLEEAILFRDGCKAMFEAIGRKEPIAKAPQEAPAKGSGA